MMKYKGYLADIAYDDTAKIFHGEVIGLKDTITFQGKSVEELRKAFQDSVNDYLAWCEERGVDWTLFRPTLIYGRGLDKNVTTIMRFIKRFHVFPIVGGGGGLRPNNSK